MKFFAAGLMFFISASVYAGTLQDAIDSAPEGSEVLLSDGLYEGPVTVSKKITIRAKDGGAFVKGNGTGSVITVKAEGVSIEGLNISGSGESHEAADACIAVKSVNGVRVAGNIMRDCLFGINFESSNRGYIENNDIKSKNFSLGLKGDGIRLWYSHSNTIKNNKMTDIRDMVFWYSSGNIIEGNVITDSRYSLHFMYADRNIITGNTYENNSVGIFLMYSHGSRIIGNKVVNSSGPFGIGIGFKEVSDCVVEDNTLMYNARGFYLDQSPYQPGTTNTFKNNKILYNTVGIQLHGITIGSSFDGNIFDGNIDSLSNDTPSSNLAVNTWNNNYWDDYEGFDRNKDGFGDTPYEHLVYVDKIMQFNPNLKLFYGSPVLSLLNFLAKLIPFSEPERLATDNNPVIKSEVIGGK